MPAVSISRPEPRTIVLVDGENLVFRFQAMKDEGRKPTSTFHHIPNVFIWHGDMLQFFGHSLRVNYYTSMVGDTETIDHTRDKIGQILVTGAGYGRRICPQVFKKDSNSRKTKLVDLTITIDALRHAYHDHIDQLLLFTGDGDYIPLVKEVMRQGKQVVVGGFSSGLSTELRRTGDQFIEIDRFFFETV